MPFYVYFISSLPMLHFGMKPPFSFEKFIALAANFIPEADTEALKKCSINGDYTYGQKYPDLKKWQDFDTALRNELVRVRSSHKHIDGSKYLRDYEDLQLHLSHLALSSHRNPNILEAEKMLDEERWRALEELSFGHYFDLDFLILYGLKLLLLERWERAHTADSHKVLAEVLEKAL